MKVLVCDNPSLKVKKCLYNNNNTYLLNYLYYNSNNNTGTCTSTLTAKNLTHLEAGRC